MSSEGSKRVKVRRRRPGVGGTYGLGGNWELENAPFTFEGQIESLSRFGRGIGSASPRMRLVAKLVALTFLLPLLFGFVAWLID